MNGYNIVVPRGNRKEGYNMVYGTWKDPEAHSADYAELVELVEALAAEAAASEAEAKG